MNQIDLLRLSIRLKPGDAISIGKEELKEAAGGDLTGLDRMGGVRDSDIKEFIAKISSNWGIEITYNILRNIYVITKKTRANPRSKSDLFDLPKDQMADPSKPPRGWVSLSDRFTSLQRK